MLSTEVHASLHVITTPAPKKAAVRIGSRYAPGTLVRLPGEGRYYEAPVEMSPDAERLQKALLARPKRFNYAPLPAPSKHPFVRLLRSAWRWL